jgi:hypothetical protein
MAASETNAAPLWALMGIVVGAVLAGGIQACIEWQKHVYEEARTRAEKAEEIMTLASEAPWLFISIKPHMLLNPLETPVPNESARVAALVEMYFPRLHQDAADFELACMQHFATLQDLVIATRKGTPSSVDDNATFANVYDSQKKLVTALRAEVTGIGPQSTYPRWLQPAGLLITALGSLLLVLFPSVVPTAADRATRRRDVLMRGAFGLLFAGSILQFARVILQ